MSSRKAAAFWDHPELCEPGALSAFLEGERASPRYWWAVRRLLWKRLLEVTGGTALSVFYLAHRTSGDLGLPGERPLLPPANLLEMARGKEALFDDPAKHPERARPAAGRTTGRQAI